MRWPGGDGAGTAGSLPPQRLTVWMRPEVDVGTLERRVVRTGRLALAVGDVVEEHGAVIPTPLTLSLIGVDGVLRIPENVIQDLSGSLEPGAQTACG